MTESRPVLDLQGEKTPVRPLLAELWRFRGLLPLLAQQEFHARYRSAKLGMLWSIFVPLFHGAVVGFVFSRIVRVETGFQFAVYVFSGTVTWAYFNSSLAAAATAIVDSAAITTKVYYPRLIPPLVPVVANIPGFGISLTCVLLLMGAVGVPLRPTLLVLPIAMAATIVVTGLLSASIALLHVYYRDVRYLVQALLMAWFYATPVFYRIHQAGVLEPLVKANPLVGCVALVRYAVFGKADALATSLWTMSASIAVLSLAVAWAYGRYNRVAADRM